ncbi:MAG: FemAB family protein [Nitrospirae bacterium]|nr:FemAB family protein [Nitrospirota bacterium]
MATDYHSYFNAFASRINAKPMVDFPADWDYVLSHASHVPTTYTPSVVAYQSAYMMEVVDEFVDLSLVLFHENRPIGVWPLNMRFSDGSWVSGSNEGPVCAPLFINKIAEKTRKNLIKGCIDALNELCRITGQKTWRGVEFIGTGGADLWHRKIMESGATIQRVAHEMFVDLSLSMEDIKGNLRKSYKSLLSTGDALWQSSIYAKVDHDTFDEFRKLHFRLSGRMTRSLQTWDLNEQAVNKGDAFLVVLRDDKGVMVGGGLFYISRTEGLYSVGVYDRSLFDKPLGHIVQMKAIEHMKTLGLRWHKLGERLYPGDSSKPNEKELSISHFKEGFATHMFLKLHIELSL